MSKVEDIAALMATVPLHEQIQEVQTAFRLRLLDTWKIPAGSKILEIGCGQGDMTAALADSVGPTGHVTAIDIAGPEYGAPLTLGEATRYLSEGPLGPRIEFKLGFDPSGHVTDFGNGAFDFIVLSHCSWYFASLEQLAKVLLNGRAWATRLCFSEWDLQPQTEKQLAHLIAVLIQGQVQLGDVHERFNVRTPFSRSRLHEMLAESGWSITTDEWVSTEGMQDGRWEAENCLRGEVLKIPAIGKEAKFLQSQLDLLSDLVNAREVEALPSYSITATGAL